MTRAYPLEYINLEAFRWSIVYLVPAIFYFYVLSVCYKNFRLKAKHLFHAIPFFAYNLYLMFGIYSVDLNLKIQFIERISEMSITKFFYFLFESLFQVYFITSLLVIKKSKKVYFENYANPDISVLTALNTITLLYYFLHFIVLIRWLVTFIYGPGEIRAWIVILDGFAFLFSTCWYLFVALSNSEFFRGVDSELKPIFGSVEKSRIKPLIAQEKNTEIEGLKKFMVEKQPYLDSSLTIQDLADQIEMPVKDLSTVINLYMDKHFFDFINEYRIEKAQRRIL